MSERVGLDVAVTLLRTWRDDRVLVRCELRLRGCLAVVLARVEAVRGAEIRLRADDEEAAIVIPFSETSQFFYGDMREDAALATKYDSALTLLLSYAPEIDGPYEAVSFVEIRDSR